MSSEIESKGLRALESGDFALAVRLLSKAIKLSDDDGSDRIKARLSEAQKRLAELKILVQKRLKERQMKLTKKVDKKRKSVDV
jgi:hypothetical protein